MYIYSLAMSFPLPEEQAWTPCSGMSSLTATLLQITSTFVVLICQLFVSLESWQLLLMANTLILNASRALLPSALLQLSVLILAHQSPGELHAQLEGDHI